MFGKSSIVLLISFSLSLYSAENAPQKNKLAKIANNVIYETVIDKSLMDFLAEELQKKEKLSGKKLMNKDELLTKLIHELQVSDLQDKLKNTIDKDILKPHIKKVIPDAEIEIYFAKRKEDDLTLKKDFLYDKSLMDAYEYLDQHPNEEKAVEDAYDKFLTQTIGKGEKTREDGLRLWKSYARNQLFREKIIKRDYNKSKALISGKITEEMKQQIRNELFSDKSRRNAFILQQCALTDEQVKKYLESKDKGGKEDKSFEQDIVNGWYIKEIEKLGFELYDKNLGTLKEIMSANDKVIEDIMSQHTEK